MKVVVTLRDGGKAPVGCVADAELHFGMDQFGAKDGEALEGLRLIGFQVWERRGGAGLNVTFPARQYSVNGERRSFALLRPLAFDSGSLMSSAQDRIRELIIAAYREATAAAVVVEAIAVPNGWQSV